MCIDRRGLDVLNESRCVWVWLYTHTHRCIWWFTLSLIDTDCLFLSARWCRWWRVTQWKHRAHGGFITKGFWANKWKRYSSTDLLKGVKKNGNLVREATHCFSCVKWGTSLQGNEHSVPSGGWKRNQLAWVQKSPKRFNYQNRNKHSSKVKLRRGILLQNTLESDLKVLICWFCTSLLWCTESIFIVLKPHVIGCTFQRSSSHVSLCLQAFYGLSTWDPSLTWPFIHTNSNPILNTATLRSKASSCERRTSSSKS